VGAINISSKTSDVVLTVTDVRSSEQVAMTEGHGAKNDIGVGARGSLFGSQNIGSAGIGGYANTTIGQVITMAYLDAYTKLVNEMGGMPGQCVGSRGVAVPRRPSSCSSVARSIRLDGRRHLY
jgi:hypothetical protein